MSYVQNRSDTFNPQLELRIEKVDDVALVLDSNRQAVSYISSDNKTIGIPEKYRAWKAISKYGVVVLNNGVDFVYLEAEYGGSQKPIILSFSKHNGRHFDEDNETYIDRVLSTATKRKPNKRVAKGLVNVLREFEKSHGFKVR